MGPKSSMTGVLIRRKERHPKEDGYARMEAEMGVSPVDFRGSEALLDFGLLASRTVRQ